MPLIRRSVLGAEKDSRMRLTCSLSIMGTAVARIPASAARHPIKHSNPPNALRNFMSRPLSRAV